MKFILFCVTLGLSEKRLKGLTWKTQMCVTACFLKIHQSVYFAQGDVFSLPFRPHMGRRGEGRWPRPRHSHCCPPPLARTGVPSLPSPPSARTRSVVSRVHAVELSFWLCFFKKGVQSQYFQEAVPIEWNSSVLWCPFSFRNLLRILLSCGSLCPTGSKCVYIYIPTKLVL